MSAIYATPAAAGPRYAADTSTQQLPETGMDNEAKAALAYAKALIESAITEIDRLKGDALAMKLVTAHLLAHTTSEAQTEARVALRLQRGRFDPRESPTLIAAFEEAARQYRA
jgi:hypothetical protein